MSDDAQGKTLESGYYWIRVEDPDGGEPEVAYYSDDGSWDRCGSDVSINKYYAPRLEVLAAIPPFGAGPLQALKDFLGEARRFDKLAHDAQLRSPDGAYWERYHDGRIDAWAETLMKMEELGG